MMSPSTISALRIFLRLRSRDVDLDETDVAIVEKFLAFSGHSDGGTNQHFIHCQPRDYAHFHIVIDMNCTLHPNVQLHQIPHELYSVSFTGEGNEP